MDDKKLSADQISPVKQALLKIREMSTKIEAMEACIHQPIAIVGVGLRFPGGCHDLDGFWRLMIEGVDAINEVPQERWDINAYYDANPDAPGKMYARHGGFLDRIDEFDPDFFGISPREAQTMDPQQRLLLEVGWEALEHAGQSSDRLAGSSTGVYLAINNSDYFRYLFTSPELIDAYTTTGCASSIAASRLSYLLNLKGPALAVDTACSSSLVAVHLALQSLRSGECDLALVGGVNLILLPEITINFCKSRMLAFDGRCKTFDASADGYVRGEGCAMIALKRFSDAQRAGDHILALIRGSAINQDGRSGGITAPNGPAQVAVIRKALEDAGIDAESVGYVEAHGTATQLGDPIEAQALGDVFGRRSITDQFLAVGTIKTNIGHLEAAAGLAGLIKTALVLQKGVIPPSLHLKQVNPHIPLKELGLTIPIAVTPWPDGPGTRIAGVSSFGLSGTNAHIIMEQAGDNDRIDAVREMEKTPNVLSLSARNEFALRESAALYESYLRNSTVSFKDICYSANTGRTHFEHRLAVMAKSGVEAFGQLTTFLKSGATPRVIQAMADPTDPPGVVFLFTGQGAQYPGMGRGLFKSQKVFRETLQECDRLLQPLLDISLLDILYGDVNDTRCLDNTRYTQPAVFALEAALMRLWRSWGIKPAAVMGHSLGEYAAACAAGVLSLTDGLRLVARRAELIASLPEDGSMAAIFADDKVVTEFIGSGKDVSVAAMNGPANTVISGRADAVHSVISKLAEKGIHSKKLNVSHAFHSALMDPILDQVAHAASEVSFSDPEIMLISNLSGKVVDPAEITRPEYWRLHLRQPVRFAESIAGLIDRGYRIFLEIGPQPVLLGMGQSMDENRHVEWLPSLRKGREDHDQMLESLSKLHVRGAAVDWNRFHDISACKRVHLPTYPFQRTRFWASIPEAEPSRKAADPTTDWDFIVASSARQSGQVPLDLFIESYEKKWRCLEALTLTYIESTLAKLRIFVKTNEYQSLDSIIADAQVLPKYRKLLQRWLLRLAKAKILREAGNGFEAVRPLNNKQLKACVDEAADTLSDQPLFFDYIQRCGRLAAEILTGRQDPLETLFPDGSSDLAEWLYGEWPVSRYISAIAASAAAAAASARSSNGLLRFIEVGAGTGGTTKAVLDALLPGQVEYWYTDISEFFFARAREKYARFSTLRFGLMNIERDPFQQGIAPASFDAVIATNVLHATVDLDAAVDNARSLLIPGGVLILTEATEDFAWHDMTTGLIEGWQRFEDKRRKKSPLLMPTSMAGGFEKPRFPIRRLVSGGGATDRNSGPARDRCSVALRGAETTSNR